MGNNPELMSQMMNSPIMQNMMNDPELLRNMLSQNPMVSQVLTLSITFHSCCPALLCKMKGVSGGPAQH